MDTLTYAWGEERAVVFMHHYSDLSGDVLFNMPEAAITRCIQPEPTDGSKVKSRVEVRIPAEALKRLIASWVAAQRISKLEQAEPDEILLGRDGQ